MARDAINPERRRIWLQVVLVGVLVGTGALAALVNYGIARAHRATLAPERKFGDLHLSLPEKWKVTVDDDGGALIVRAAEPGETPFTRQLLILRQRSSEFISPMEYLERLGAWTPPATTTDGASGLSPIEIAGRPGVFMQRAPRRLAGGDSVQPKLIQACVVLPSRTAILIRLESLDEINPADEQLVREIAASVRLDSATSIANISNTGSEVLPVSRPGGAGGSMMLDGGIQVAVPSGFVLENEPDPDRISRVMLYTDPACHWVSIELVPFLLESDQPDVLLGIVALHGQRWLGAHLTSLGTRQWRIDPAIPGEPTKAKATSGDGKAAPPGDVDHGVMGTNTAPKGDSAPASGEDDAAYLEHRYPARAFIIAGDRGQAILAIMHGGPVQPGMLNDAWQSIARSVRFAQPKAHPTTAHANGEVYDLPSLLANGADEVHRLSGDGGDDNGQAQGNPGQAATGIPGLGLDPLLPVREEQWWLWCSDNRDHYLGWSHFYWGDDSDSLWRATRETRRRAPDGVYRIVQSWVSNAAMTEYLCTTNRYESPDAADHAALSAAGPGGFIHTGHKAIQLKDGMLMLRYAVTDGRAIVERREPADKQPEDNRKPSTRAASPPAEDSKPTTRDDAVPMQTAFGAAPAQYIPGGWLPQLLGQLQPKPMILKTDQFPGYEGVEFVGLLTLIVEPGPPLPPISIARPNAGDDRAAGDANRAATSRSSDAEREASRRVVRVRINGSGEISRWTFINRDELQSVDFPDGIRRLPIDRQDLKLDFDNDERLNPDTLSPTRGR